MVKGLNTSFKKWKRFFKHEDGLTKVLSKITTAQTGTRAWPNKTKDHNVSFRLDYGQLYMSDGRQLRDVVVQPNKGTKDSAAAAAANANSHQILARYTIDVNSPPTEGDFAAALGEMLARG